jgi:hypothetical protein
VRGLLRFEEIVPGGGADGHPPIEARCGYPRFVKSVSCMPSGPRMRTFRSFQGVVTASATISAPPRASHSAVASLSATLNAMRTGPAKPITDLDLVDQVRLLLVHELERRTPCIENDDLRVAFAPVPELREAESVTVERHRRLEVRDGEHQPELLDVAHPHAHVTLL